MGVVMAAKVVWATLLVEAADALAAPAFEEPGGALAGTRFAFVFFLFREVCFGRLKVCLGLFQTYFGALGVERGEQLSLRDVLPCFHVDVRDGAARLEAEVELVGRLDVAAAGYRRLHDAAFDGRGPGALPARLRRRPDRGVGENDRRDADRDEQRVEHRLLSEFPRYPFSAVASSVARQCCRARTLTV